MPESTSNAELLQIPARWDFEYTYFAGATASRFFAELRDHKQIVGTRCPGCERTLVPARAYCDACFRETDEWVAIGTSGRIEAFTIVAMKFPGLPDPPLAIVYVTLEGADTAILNYLDGIDLSDIDAAAEVLMRWPAVEVVFEDEPQGRITDFHFRLVS
ncbi:MAG: Zn-ribbon domain-containing OB-fold protein [Solirubrobacteraceae bacterium]